MNPERARHEPELTLEIVPTEREEYERSPLKKEDAFWVWNTDPSKVPGRKGRVS
jgi:hypothetical protein